MKWIDDYATGVPHIDNQHRMIFQMANDFRAALDGGQGERTYGLLLRFLDGYCRGHFRHEERCMEEYLCPVAEKNKEAHAKFIEVFHDFSQRYERNGYRPRDGRELVDFVDRWLDSHICSIDTKLRQSVTDARRRRPTGASDAE